MDLGIDSNFEERTSTMYKTIVTDTGFVEVPVNRTDHRAEIHFRESPGGGRIYSGAAHP